MDRNIQLVYEKINKYKSKKFYIDFSKIIKNAYKLIKGKGRILVRKSGTESKIRVMGESENKALLYKCVNMITKKIK